MKRIFICLFFWIPFLANSANEDGRTVIKMNGYTGRIMGGTTRYAKNNDWVWSDGSHPSIAIWDAINENWDNYIGGQLIPELKKLDPTRVWDAGYMTGDQMVLDEMDEPHPYQGPMPWTAIPAFNKNPYPLGNLDFKPEMIQKLDESGTAQLINEYGWVWLWRNGTPSKLTVNFYNITSDLIQNHSRTAIFRPTGCSWKPNGCTVIPMLPGYWLFVIWPTITATPATGLPTTSKTSNLHQRSTGFDMLLLRRPLLLT